MRGPIRIVGLAALAVCAFAAFTVSQASAALMGRAGNTPFLAIYGNPPAAGPVGGGLALNFGFGENMLFEADTGVLGKNLKLELEAGGVKVAEAESKEAFIGGTLMSNKTGANLPLGFAVQFVDFQRNFTGPTTETPSYTDTHDRQWLTNICPTVAGATCKVDPLIVPGNAAGEVKIENVSFNIGPGVVVQGTVWGNWKDGKETGGVVEPPCITLKSPIAAVAANTLYETQGPNVGAKAIVGGVTGEACLLSANNDWEEGKHNIITIKNE
jgi:hypothetical protein